MRQLHDPVHQHEPVLPDLSELTAEQLERITRHPLRCAVCGGEIELRCGPMPIKGSFANRAGRTYKPKPCRTCTRDFTPKGPRDDICTSCRGGAV